MLETPAVQNPRLVPAVDASGLMDALSRFQAVAKDKNLRQAEEDGITAGRGSKTAPRLGGGTSADEAFNRGFRSAFASRIKADAELDADSLLEPYKRGEKPWRTADWDQDSEAMLKGYAAAVGEDPYLQANALDPIREILNRRREEVLGRETQIHRERMSGAAAAGYEQTARAVREAVYTGNYASALNAISSWGATAQDAIDAGLDGFNEGTVAVKLQALNDLFAVEQVSHQFRKGKRQDGTTSAEYSWAFFQTVRDDPDMAKDPALRDKMLTRLLSDLDDQTVIDERRYRIRAVVREETSREQKNLGVSMILDGELTNRAEVKDFLDRSGVQEAEVKDYLLGWLDQWNEAKAKVRSDGKAQAELRIRAYNGRLTFDQLSYALRRSTELGEGLTPDEFNGIAAIIQSTKDDAFNAGSRMLATRTRVDPTTGTVNLGGLSIAESNEWMIRAAAAHDEFYRRTEAEKSKEEDKRRHPTQIAQDIIAEFGFDKVTEKEWAPPLQEPDLYKRWVTPDTRAQAEVDLYLRINRKYPDDTETARREYNSIIQRWTIEK
jgi:hypothetical protein